MERGGRFAGAAQTAPGAGPPAGPPLLPGLAAWPEVVPAGTLPDIGTVKIGLHRTRPVRGELHPASLASRSGIAVLSLSVAQAAQAYIGPGLGMSAIVVALGGAGFLLALLFTAFWYPFKRMFRRRRAKTAAASRHDDEPHADTGEDGTRR